MLRTKQLFCAFCILVMLLSLAACGQPEPGTAAGTTTTDIPTSSTQQETNQTTAPTQVTEPSQPSDTMDLVGTWGSYRREDNILYSSWYTFHADGTFLSGGHDYPSFYYHPYPDEGPIGTWYTAAHGGVAYYGVYHIEGSVLTLTFQCHDFDDFEDYDVVCEILDFDGDFLTLDNQFGKYYNSEIAEGRSMEECCALIGVDGNAGPSADDGIDPEDLVNTWISIRREGDVLYTNSYTFNADGTFSTGGYEYYNVKYFPMEDAGADAYGWYLAPMGYCWSHGTYTLEGSVLTLTYEYDDYDDFEDFTQTYTLEATNGIFLLLNDRYGTYINPQETYDYLDHDEPWCICAHLGVDYEP